MMGSSSMRLVAMISWGVTAIASILVGLIPLGMNFFQFDFMMTMPMVSWVIHIIIGICGLFSLGMMIMALGGKSACGCAGYNCHCK
jgi:uncharacterized membrane protein YuzA (DUF378 family)